MLNIRNELKNYFKTHNSSADLENFSNMLNEILEENKKEAEEAEAKITKLRAATDAINAVKNFIKEYYPNFTEEVDREELTGQYLIEFLDNFEVIADTFNNLFDFKSNNTAITNINKTAFNEDDLAELINRISQKTTNVLTKAFEKEYLKNETNNCSDSLSRFASKF